MQHSVQLNDGQIRKLMNGKSVQLQHHGLIAGGSLISMNKAMSNKLNKALKLGKGVRLSLSENELMDNIKSNKDFRRLLTKAKAKRIGIDKDNENDEGEVEGGNIARDFRNFGKMLNKKIIKPMNDNKEGILKSFSSVAIPLATSALSKYTGLNFNGGNKIMTDYTNRRITKDLGRKKVVSMNDPVPNDIQEQPQYIQPVQNDATVITHGSGFITRGGSLVDGMVGFSMARRAKPIGKPKPRGIMNINNGYDNNNVNSGQGLYPSGYNGRGLYPSGY